MGNAIRQTFVGGIEVDVKDVGQTQANTYPRDAKGVVIAHNTLAGIGADSVKGGVAAISVRSDATAKPPRVAQDIVIAFNSIRGGSDPAAGAASPAGAKPEPSGGNTACAFDLSGVTAAERATIQLFGNAVAAEIPARINGTFDIISGHVVDRPTLDFGAIAAGAVAEQTVAVTGAATGDSVQVTPVGGLEAGLQVGGAWVSAADQVTVRVHTLGASAVRSSRPWRVILTQH